MTKDLIVSIDCSTTASKVILWDRLGNAVSEGRSPIQLFSPCQGWFEQSPLEWWQATVSAISQACAKVDKSRLAAICITHQRETFVPVDQHNNPLYNGIVWMDERCRKLLPSLEDIFGNEKFHSITGKPLSVNLTIGKIAWLKELEPEIFANTVKYLDVHAYLVTRLTGNCSTGWGSADPTGMFDMRQNEWAIPFIDAIGVRAEQLPAAYPPGEILGTISTLASVSTGIPKGVPVVAGIGDGQMSGLGANITHPGDAYLALGTSVVTGIYGDSYITHPSFRTMYGGIVNSYLYENALMGGGFTLNWFYENFARAEIDYALEASKLHPGSEGLFLVPYWNSVLGPYWDSDASGIVVGWRGNHSSIHLYRAILEGIAYEQRLCTSEVEKATLQTVNRYIVQGGGSQNNLWCQIIADVTGKEINRTKESEAAALGCGIIAAHALGWYPSVKLSAESMVKILSQSFQPIPEHHAFYSQAYTDVYIHLYPLLRTRLGLITGYLDSCCL